MYLNQKECSGLELILQYRGLSTQCYHYTTFVTDDGGLMNQSVKTIKGMEEEKKRERERGREGGKREIV